MNRASLKSYLHSGLPINCATPNVVADEGMLEYPGIVGTGFFAIRNNRPYYFTALHCAITTPNQNSPKFQTLLVPHRLEGHTNDAQDFIRVDSAITIEQHIDNALDYRLDLVAYPIIEPQRARDRKHLFSRCAKLPPSGDWLERFLETELGKKALVSGKTLSARCIGYPRSSPATKIEYGIGSKAADISTQLVVFSGNVTWSSVEHCLKLEKITWHENLSGFSGSPVFVQLLSEHGPQFALIGMIICGADDHASFIRVSSLVKAIDTITT